LKVSHKDNLLQVIVEMVGRFVDGIEAATSVTLGQRTLRVEDYGK
jgi:formylmethanofuran dehydrogenase subunit E